jgi:hypothetical protein
MPARPWLAVVAAVLFFGTWGVTGVDPGTLETAQVVDVNARLQVVVLNVGREAGVRIGMPFLVLRGDRLIGRVRVVEVRRQVCGARIEEVDKGVTLAAGDAARVARSSSR